MLPKEKVAKEEFYEGTISAEDLASLVGAYNPRTNVNLIRQAYAYGMAMHDGQFRKSGEPYFTHPVAVAKILAEQYLDDATIITALLHDTIEDTRSTYADIAKLFGEEVAELVDGVTKLTNLEIVGNDSKHAENFRKLFMAMSRDLRVILVKLSDRLHNMRTIRNMPPEKQLKKARETMEIFAPLAGRMGMHWMREELEDLSFKVLNPDARKSIMRRFLILQRETGDVIHKITADIVTELKRIGVKAVVYGRAKKPYSIWRKMQEKDLSFSRLSDIYGFRIICDTVPDCYHILGKIHQRWRAVPGRFKDYISQPKSNGYRSIHTTVSGRDGKRVEVQIRTKQIHEVAESGVAAHWSYREGVQVQNPFAVDPGKWISSLAERFDQIDHDEFIEHVKLEMYSDQVFCFTPKGDVVQLPRGATPLDFAYSIHTRIGNATVSAKVDGLRVPLWTRLRNGQSVEILTAEGQKPEGSWIEIVKTGRAKAAIRKSLRDEERHRHIKLGQELTRAAFEHVGKRASDKALRTAARMLGMQEDDQELLARIGAAELKIQQVIEALYPDVPHSNLSEIDAERPVLGLPQNQKFVRASCCQPLPGERIVGISEQGKEIVAHAIDCMTLAQFEEQPENWVDLLWHPGRHAVAHTVTFTLTISNDAGVLGRICTLVGEQHANISNLVFTDRKPDYYGLLLDIDLRDIEHLHRIITVLDAESDIVQVTRQRDLARKH